MANEDLRLSLGLDTRPAEQDIDRIAQKAAKAFSNVGVSNAAQNINFSSAEKSLNNFANQASSKLKRAFSNAKINDRQFVEPLGKVVRSVSEFDKSMEAANARVLAFGASTGVVLAVQRSFRALVSATIEVEKELKDINVVLNLNDKQLSSLKRSLFDVANNTGQAFNVVAEGAKELSRQGLGASETINRLNDAMVLTRLSGLGAQESVEALTAAINSYTKSLLTSRDIVNTIATVDAAFAVSSADLAEGLKRVGSSAEDAGVSFEQLIALITSTQQITNRGGTVIGNAFKTIFTRLNRPEVLDQLESLGVTVRKSSGEVLPATKILEQYANISDKLSPALRSNIDELIGSVFQINQLKALIKDLNSEYGIYSRALDIANNKTSDAILRNQELNTTIAASLQATKNNIQQFSSNIGNTLISGNLKNVLDIVNSVVGSEAGDSVGAQFGRGLLKGIADFVAGPGLLLIVSAAAGIAKGFVNFAKESFQSIQKTIFAKQSIVDISKETEKYLTIESQTYQDILNKNLSIADAAKAITQEINRSTKSLKDFKFVSDAVNASIAKGNVVVRTNTGITLDPRDNRSKGTTGRANSFAPSPLAQAIQREQAQTGLPISKIKIGQDPRLVSPDNPTGLGVYNTRDEPLGLSQGIEREKALGNDPKKMGFQSGKIPSFAAPKVLSTQKPFTSSIGDIIGTEANSALNDLSKALNNNEKEMNVLSRATRKFYKDIFTKGGIEKAYNNFADALDKAGVEQSKRTKISNELQVKGENILKQYNQNLQSLSNHYNKKTQNARDVFSAKSVARQENDRIRAINDKIQKAETLGSKGGLSGFIGLNAIRAGNQLKSIGTDDAILAKRRVDSNFGSGSKTLIASIAAPLAAGIINEFATNTFFKDNPNSTGARSTGAFVSGLGNIAGFAGTGAALGGPYGALAGAGVGVISTIFNVFSEFQNTLPDLTEALRKTTSEITSINDSLSRIDQLRNDLNKETSPQNRIKLQSDLIKELAKAAGLGVEFNKSGEAVNVEKKLDALSRQQLNEAIVRNAKLVKESPKNDTARNDFLSLFSNFKFDGKDLASTILTGSGGETVVAELEKANKNLLNNQKRLENLNSTPLNSSNIYSISPIVKQARDIENENEKLIENLFKNILPKDLFEGIRKNGGNDIFKLLFESLRDQLEAGKQIVDNQQEQNKINQQTIALTRQLNEKFLALSASINLAAQINNARKTGRSSVSGIIQETDKSFGNFAGLFSNERSLLDFNFLRDGKAIQRRLDDNLKNNSDNQRQTTSESISSFLQKINRDLFEIKGLEGFNEAFSKLESFANNFDPTNAEAQISTLENDIINIIKNTNDGLSLGKGQNANIFNELFESIKQNEKNRLQNDEVLKSEAGASRIALEANLDIQKKILAAQEKINFGGGISSLINGNISQDIFDASNNALFGDTRQSLQGGFKLAEIAQTLGLQQPLKEEIISGLAEEIKRVVTSIGGNINDTDARSIAETQFNNRFKSETPAEVLSNKLDDLQSNFVNQTKTVFLALERQIINLSDTIKNNFALNLEKALLLNAKEDDAQSENPSEIAKRLLEINTQLSKTSKSELVVNAPELQPLILRDQAKATDDLNISISKSISLSKANEKSLEELNRQRIETIKNNRDLVVNNRELASSIAQVNAQIRAVLIQNGSISAGKAFSDNLFDSLNSNSLEFQTNFANSGLELGLEIKSSFKSAISSMVKDIDNFEDAAKQAFIAILDKVTDIGVGNFVDQGLAAVTNAVKPVKKATGGIVTGGSGVKDDVPAILQGGEFVIRKSVVDKLGPSFFEGLNSSSGSAAITLQNAFEANSTRPTKISDGQLNIDPSLSAFALSDSNNPQNQKRFDTESEFLRYIESLRDYEASIDQAMRAYKKQKKNIITQGFLSAFFNFAALGLGNINGKSSKSTSISNGSLGSTDLKTNTGIGGSFAVAATGGMSKDTIPALLQGGEFVASKNAVDKFGVGFFKRLNEGKINPRKFATGGFVQSNNTNFVQPVNGQSQNIDMTPVVNSINQLSNAIKDSKIGSSSQTQQSSPINNISINVTIQKDGSVQTTQTSQGQQSQDGEKQNGQRLAELIRSSVYEVILKEKRPNGILYIPSR